MINFTVANWGKLERKIMIRHLLSLGASGSNKSIDKLRSYLAQQTQADDLFLLNSARAGIRLALAWALEKSPDKKEVLVPSYICPSVVETVEQMGLKPILVDVNEHLLITPDSVKKKLSERSLAVIVAHMYSAVADTRSIKAIADQFGTIVIDDAAQRSGTREGNTLVGHDGDVGIVSFAQAKTIVTGVKASGGVIFSQQNDFSVFCQSRYRELPNSSRRWYAMLHFCLSYILGGKFKQIDYYLQRIQQKLKWQPNYYRMSKIGAIDAQLAYVQYQSLPNRVRQITDVLAIYKQAFKELSTIEAVQLTENTEYLSRFVIRSKRIPPQLLMDKLSKSQIASKKCYLNGSNTFDGTFASGLLEIPLTGITVKDAEHIVNTLKTLDTL